MKLLDVLTQLSVGELSQISIGGGEAGVIRPADYAKIVPSINLGLTALFSRFPIKEGRLNVTLVPGKQLYVLDPKYAASNTGSSELVKYITDTVDEPFTGNLLKIEQVLTPDDYEFILNDRDDIYSITTPSHNSFRLPSIVVAGGPDLPEELKITELDVVFRENHYKIGGADGDFDPEEDEVYLPDAYLEALLLFVASRVHNPIGMTNEFNAGNNYAAKYERACQLLESKDLYIDQGSQGFRLFRNGWV